MADDTKTPAPAPAAPAAQSSTDVVPITPIGEAELNDRVNAKRGDARVWDPRFQGAWLEAKRKRDKAAGGS